MLRFSHLCTFASALALAACGSTTSSNGEAPEADAAADDAAFESSTADDASPMETTAADTSSDSAAADSMSAADAPEAHSTLFGGAFNPHDDMRTAELVSQWGGLGVVRAYDANKGVAPFLATIQALDIKYGAASAYSFKYPPTEVTAGTHDKEIAGFFDGIADGHVVYWTYWHEPDDEIYKSHTFTPAEYRAAWKHLRGLADAARAKRPKLVVHATLIIMEYSMRPEIASTRPLLGAEGMYPGDDVIEVFGVDAYNDKTGLRDAATQFGKVIDFAKSHGKPWAIGELGSCPNPSDPSLRATYLTKAIQYWKSRAYLPEYVAYFDIDWPTCDYRLDTDAAATKVWHDAVSKGVKAF